MDIHIPPAALEAGARAIHARYGFTSWEDMGESEEALECARAAFVAMVKAWPGTRIDDTYRWLSNAAIILPMEDKNAES